LHESELHGDASILVVDDSDEFRREAAAYLRGLGYDVCEAGNSEAAVSLARRLKRLDLLVTDVLTPGETGLVLAMRLRAEWPGLPVQFVTDTGIGPELADEDVLTKPFPWLRLASATLKRLGRSMPSDGQGDRVLKRVKTPALRQFCLYWIMSKADGPTLPDLASLDPARFGVGPHAFTVSVEQSDPFRFRYLSVGAALSQRLDGLVNKTFGGAAETDDIMGDSQNAYHRCTRSRSPVYQAAKFSFKNDPPHCFERLLLPISEKSQAVTHIVGVVLFCEPEAALLV
jgi:CheY-like chemotaxis protein